MLYLFFSLTGVEYLLKTSSKRTHIALFISLIDVAKHLSYLLTYLLMYLLTYLLTCKFRIDEITYSKSYSLEQHVTLKALFTFLVENWIENKYINANIDVCIYKHKLYKLLIVENHSATFFPWSLKVCSPSAVMFTKYLNHHIEQNISEKIQSLEEPLIVRIKLNISSVICHWKLLKTMDWKLLKKKLKGVNINLI